MSITTTAPIRQALPGVATGVKRQPPRVILQATEKWGKSSFAAHAPRPIFLMSKSETGLLTLIDRGQVPPDTPYFEPDVPTFAAAAQRVRELIDCDHDRQTLAIDVANGLCRQAEETVCNRNFGGDWSAYEDYGRGAKITRPLWARFFELLDELRAKRGMAVILLMHSRVKTVKNPEGPDFDRYVPDLPDVLWGPAHKWADAILFGHVQIGANKEKGARTAKGAGGRDRILCCQPSAAWVAGNRYGLPDRIPCGNSPAAAWASFATAMKARPKE